MYKESSPLLYCTPDIVTPSEWDLKSRPLLRHLPSRLRLSK
ncbi:1925_t:CDS:2 [Gigaspora margarita]|uniref:1925_t:CDS:1 n=1 Tax=Gigaspora margarita TaxID=4874 RepID=A0ABN7US74_GIGMA|nr:1925_t:CDS:2 [Gigaspora margarita]